VEVVTGGGKTTFALLCIAEAMRQDPEVRVLIIVPTEALLDQWVVALQVDANVPADEIATYSGTSHPDQARRYNVAIINTARRRTPELTGAGTWFLCVDECHRAGSEKNADALRGKFAYTLGLSATPQRQYDPGFEEHVVPALGPVIYRYTYAEARRDEIIVPFDLIHYRVPMMPEERAAYSKLSMSIARLAARVEAGEERAQLMMQRLLLKRASVSLNARWRVPVAVRVCEEHGSPALVFHERITAADEIATLLDRRGRRVTVYHSGIGRSMRSRNLLLFRRQVADTLVTCRALDEGLNVPNTSVGIVAASSRSVRQRIQRLGRILRPAPGKRNATICTLYCTDTERADLEAEAVRLADVASVSWREVRECVR
jgi:superfamily II DNA or RNA helicase